jgi:hypothetical protein
MRGMLSWRRRLWFLGALLLLLAGLWIVPHSTGLRLRFWVMTRTAVRPSLGPAARPGLLRVDYMSPDFQSVNSALVDSNVELKWPADTDFRQRSVRWSGWLEIPNSGDWELGLRSDDGSALILDGAPVLTNWGRHTAQTRWRRLWLTRGFHRLRLDFFQGDGAGEIALLWRAPVGPRQTIPARFLHRTEGPIIVPWASSMEVHEPVANTAQRSGWSWSDYWMDLRPEGLLAAGTLGTIYPQPRRTFTGRPGAVRVWRAQFALPVATRLGLRFAGPATSRILMDGATILRGAGSRPPTATTTEISAGPGLRRLAVIGRGTDPFPPLTVENLDLKRRVEPACTFDPAENGLQQPAGSPLATWIEAVVDHSPDLSLVAPYVFRWDVQKMGHPAAPAPLRATWDGAIRLPEKGMCTITLRASGRAFLSVGDQFVFKGIDTAQVSLRILAKPGSTLPLSLDVQEEGPSRDVRLMWKTEGHQLEIIPASALVPPALATTRQFQLWGTAILALTILIMLRRWGLRAYLTRLWSHRVAHLQVLVIVAGVLLRLHQYAEIPHPGETADEFTHHMLGMSLTAGDPPLAWDWHDSYPLIRYVPLHGAVFRLCAPQRVYPPLYSVLVGLVNRLAGAVSPFEWRLHATRLLSVGLAILSLILMWPVGRAVGMPRSHILLATAFLATYPPAVIMGRLIKEEALMTVVYMALIWLVAGYSSKSGLGRRTAIGVLILACLLTKQMGIAAVLFAFVAMALRRRYKPAVLFALYGVLGIGLFVWWGFSWGRDSFLGLLQELAGSNTLILAFGPLLTENLIVESIHGNGWALGLWIAAAAFAARRPDRKSWILSLSIFCYLVAIFASYPAQRNFGWYRLPTFPLLALAWGSETGWLFRRYEVIPILGWVGLFLLHAIDDIITLAPRWLGAQLVLTDVGASNIIRITVAATVVPAALVAILPRVLRRFSRWLLAGALTAVLFIAFAICAWNWDYVDRKDWLHDPVTVPEELTEVR